MDLVPSDDGQRRRGEGTFTLSGDADLLQTTHEYRRSEGAGTRATMEGQATSSKTA